MFVRSKKVKGRIYYQAVKTYRKDGRILQRVVMHLGQHSTLEAAYQDARKRYFALRKGRRRKPHTDEEAKLWERLEQLSLMVPWKIPWADESFRWERDYRPWECEERKREQERQKAREEERSQRFWEYWITRKSEEQLRLHATLGLRPPASPEQIKAAYRSMAKQCHPDHGGSNEAMAKVNEAYEQLLGE